MCRISTKSSWEVAQDSYDVCHVSAQSIWQLAQGSYDVCYVSTQSSWEVPESSYYACHVSAQSSWEVAQSSYDVCHISTQSSWKVAQVSCSTNTIGLSTKNIYTLNSENPLKNLCSLRNISFPQLFVLMIAKYFQLKAHKANTLD